MWRVSDGHRHWYNYQVCRERNPRQKHRTKSRGYTVWEKDPRGSCWLLVNTFTVIGAWLHLWPRFYKIPSSHYKSCIYLNLAERVPVTYKQRDLDQHTHCDVDESGERWGGSVNAILGPHLCLFQENLQKIRQLNYSRGQGHFIVPGL